MEKINVPCYLCSSCLKPFNTEEEALKHEESCGKAQQDMELYEKKCSIFIRTPRIITKRDFLSSRGSFYVETQSPDSMTHLKVAVTETLVDQEPALKYSIDVPGEDTITITCQKNFVHTRTEIEPYGNGDVCIHCLCSLVVEPGAITKSEAEESLDRELERLQYSFQRASRAGYFC